MMGGTGIENCEKVYDDCDHFIHPAAHYFRCIQILF